MTKKEKSHADMLYHTDAPGNLNVSARRVVDLDVLWVSEVIVAGSKGKGKCDFSAINRGMYKAKGTSGNEVTGCILP